jgi:hypothetical protein
MDQQSSSVAEKAVEAAGVGVQGVASTAGAYIRVKGGRALVHLPGLVLVHRLLVLVHRWLVLVHRWLHLLIHRQPLRGGSMLSPTQPRKRVGGRHD